MIFKVVSYRVQPPAGRSEIYLIRDNWDDVGKFETLFKSWYRDAGGEAHELGEVKIGQLGMGEGHRVAEADKRGSLRSPKVPEEFEELPADFFSLGQDESYYAKLKSLHVRAKVLRKLRDLAYDLDLLESVIEEPVTQVSLMRHVTESTIREQFHRLAHGGSRLTSYEFEYVDPQNISQSLQFRVRPHTRPPSNIHVLIGSNGVGKTRILNNMARAFVQGDTKTGIHLAHNSDKSDEFFASLVTVSFSAFDPFQPMDAGTKRGKQKRYSYIGLRREGDPNGSLKDGNELATEFSDSIRECSSPLRKIRWLKAIRLLEADPVFRDKEVTKLVVPHQSSEKLRIHSESLFKDLSSGHKIVLLTMTKLVETVAERTLVLIDEPEAHLHPPFLGAFIRAISELLIDRNGVAIVATHSPVVLQEVPKNCVYKIQRSGELSVSRRPRMETFGENVGVLTSEVFGLDVRKSGFHKFISNSVNEQRGYDAVIAEFKHQLGSEAKALVRALLLPDNLTEDGDVETD
jgi:predicted ATPase